MYIRTYAAYECCVVAKESTINWGCCGRVINDYSGLWRNKHIVAVLSSFSCNRESKTTYVHACVVRHVQGPGLGMCLLVFLSQ